MVTSVTYNTLRHHGHFLYHSKAHTAYLMVFIFYLVWVVFAKFCAKHGLLLPKRNAENSTMFILERV